jgi:hypothetical protein
MTVAGFCKLVTEPSTTGNLLFGQQLEDYPVPSSYPCRIDTLGMESVCSSETQISTFQITIRCYNPEDLSMKVHGFQNKICPSRTELLAGGHSGRVLQDWFFSQISCTRRYRSSKNTVLYNQPREELNTKITLRFIVNIVICLAHFVRSLFV